MFGNEVVMDDLKWSHSDREKSQTAKGTGWVKGGPNTLQIGEGRTQLESKDKVMKKTFM